MYFNGQFLTVFQVSCVLFTMALRIGFKIHRYLGQNKLKFLLNNDGQTRRSYSSKPKYVIHPVRRLKSSSHTTFVPRKYANTKPMAVAYRAGDLQVNEYEMDAYENDLQPSAMPEYFTSTLESNLANFPEKSDLVRGRFAKSSTQSALTVPLKMPRLANPFPERLKAFPSDTMADDEKAKLMEDEMKMVARYNLQRSQESAAYEHHQPPAALQYHEDDVGWREAVDHHELQPPAAAEDDVEDALMQSRRPQVRPKPRTGRYLQQQRRFSSSVAGLADLSDLEQCDVILDRLRAQYPEYRTTLKKPLFVPGSPEEREFIETTLRCIAKHKQDDAVAVVKRAAAPFPSYSEVKTFVREPRMREVKRSYSTTSEQHQVLSGTRPNSDHSLQELVAQAQALESTGTWNLTEKASTGTTSEYRVLSETRPESLQDQVRGSTTWKPTEKMSTSTTSEHRVLSEMRPESLQDQVRGSTTWKPTDKASTSRRFSTRPNMCKKDKKKEKPTCKTMKSPGCADPNPTKCEYVYEKTTCKKLAAPYPSYSECMGDQYEEEPSECKICPWKIPSKHAHKATSTTADDDGKKKYSTYTAAAAAATTAAADEKIAAPTKKPPCKNPYTDKKPCDFERAAQKQDEKRRKRPHQPSQPKPNPKPASKKSFSTLTHAFHTFSNSRLHPQVSKQYSTQSLTDNRTIVDRIRRWLNSWRPGSDNIRITQSADACAGRETYIIEIQDVVVEPRPETAPWISSESLRPAAAHHVAHMSPAAGYSCAESSGKKPGKVGAGCPPPKKKESVSDDKKKCRQKKKRKLPSCNDVGKDKSKKDALNYSSIQIGEDQRASIDQLSQHTQEINALKEPKVPGQFENVPFKLKPQFWRV